ncbi:MAG: hypothetical protein ACYS7Y_25450 [Planctomycetota bacterium]|jgi:hypothetical protein
MRLVEALPKFSSELSASLETLGRNDLKVQIDDAEIERYTFDDSCNAVYIYLRSAIQLNIVEQNIIGVKHGETVPVEHECFVNGDTDNSNRLCGIELLNGSDVAKKLSEVMAP